MIDLLNFFILQEEGRKKCDQSDGTQDEGKPNPRLPFFDPYVAQIEQTLGPDDSTSDQIDLDRSSISISV